MNNQARKKKLKRDNKTRRIRMKDPVKRKHARDVERKYYRDNPKEYTKKLKRNAGYTRKETPEQKGRRLARVRKFGKKQREEDRLSALVFYGGKCVCCGESELQFLTIDHMYGGGSKHRRQIKGKSIYRWLRQNNYPRGFRTFCYNCNGATSYGRTCPHRL